MNKWYFDAANFAASNVYGIIGLYLNWFDELEEEYVMAY